MEKVGQNSNNVGLYTTIGTVLGAGVGAGTSYYLKPYLKNGVPKDSFEKEISKNLEVLKKGKLEQLKNAKTNDEIVKIVGEKALNRKYPKQTIDAIKKGDHFDAFINGQNLIELEFKNYIKPKELYDDVIKNAENLSKELVDTVEKAIKAMNKKYALVWGGIAALTAGLGTYLLTINSKQ